MPLLDPHQLRAFGRVSTLGLEIVLSTLIGFFGGRWLDTSLGTHPWMMWFGLAVGLCAAVKSVHRVLVSVRRELDSIDQNREKEPQDRPDA
ncbi:MAG: AtpZ/AtpI family protein [Myxococcota bacterium]